MEVLVGMLGVGLTPYLLYLVLLYWLSDFSIRRELCLRWVQHITAKRDYVPTIRAYGTARAVRNVPDEFRADAEAAVRPDYPFGHSFIVRRAAPIDPFAGPQHADPAVHYDEILFPIERYVRFSAIEQHVWELYRREWIEAQLTEQLHDRFGREMPNGVIGPPTWRFEVWLESRKAPLSGWEQKIDRVVRWIWVEDERMFPYYRPTFIGPFHTI